VFRDTELLITKTSIDSLNPDSPIFPTLLQSPHAPWVRYHNIIGMIENSGWFSQDTVESDGIVTVESAKMNDAQTQIVVQANHGSVHTTPRAILEVRRILIEHLRDACENPQLAASLDLPEEWKQVHRQVPRRSTQNSEWLVQPARGIAPSANWPEMLPPVIQAGSVYPSGPESHKVSGIPGQTLR
jgi:hypothetical protein